MPTVLWIVIGLAVIAVCTGSGKGKGKASGTGKPYRVDHPHYISDDESECSVCGARFRDKSMVCPRCGVRFGTAREDDEEFIEEMEIWDGDDD